MDIICKSVAVSAKRTKPLWSLIALHQWCMWIWRRCFQRKPLLQAIFLAAFGEDTCSVHNTHEPAHPAPTVVLRDMVWWGNIDGRCTIRLDDLGGLFWPWWFYDSMTLLVQQCLSLPSSSVLPHSHAETQSSLHKHKGFAISFTT